MTLSAWSGTAARRLYQSYGMQQHRYGSQLLLIGLADGSALMAGQSRFFSEGGGRGESKGGRARRGGKGLC